MRAPLPGFCIDFGTNLVYGLHPGAPQHAAEPGSWVGGARVAEGTWARVLPTLPPSPLSFKLGVIALGEFYILCRIVYHSSG